VDVSKNLGHKKENKNYTSDISLIYGTLPLGRSVWILAYRVILLT